MRKIYDEIHMALWASLVAFVAWFLLFAAPKLPEARAEAEAARMHEIAGEQDLCCGRLGMGPQTPDYQRCISYLQEYRARVERRLADETEF
jgi:hypothetical protein